MNTTSWSLPTQRVPWLVRVGDYAELTKPRIGVLVLIVVACSSYVAAWGQLDHIILLRTLMGTALVAASASAFNQWIERDRDRRMDRTAERPLPAGRLSSLEVFAFGVITVIAGISLLWGSVSPLTAAWAALTWFFYVCLYTPLKTRTPMNTFVGAFAGAMPVMIGWSSMNGHLDVRAAGLFFVVFLWQYPHFMAIAWLYRKQYATAKIRMITVVDSSGRKAGVQAILGATALLPVSFIPAVMFPSATLYLSLAFVLGVVQWVFAWLFFLRRDEIAARRLLRVSIIYLPVLLGSMTLLPHS